MRKMMVNFDKQSKKYLALIMLMGFVLGYGILYAVLSNACVGCSGGWVPLPAEQIQHFAPIIPLWLILIAGLSFGFLFSELWIFVKNKRIKWIPIVVCALCYAACLYYGYFILPINSCPQLIC